MPSHTSSEKSFPYIQSKPSLVQVQATSPCPVAFYQEEETSPHLTTISFQVVVESVKGAAENPFPQTKRPHIPC